MGDYFIGLDMGTGGCKAALINDQGEVLGYSFKEYPIINERPNWSEHNPTFYWQHVCEMFKEILQESRISAQEVKGVGVSSALPALVMIDSAGNTLHNAYNLMDRRATKEVEWIKENIGEDHVYSLTGYQLGDFPTFVNLMWEKNNRPESYKKIFKGLTIGGYIVYLLTGKTSINRSDAYFFGAYDIRKNVFDEKLINDVGLDLSIFPDVNSCEEIVGHVNGYAASDCGLVEGIPVASQADAMAGWIGAGAHQIGDFQCNLGSVGNFGIIHSDLDFIDSKIGYLMGINSPYTIDDTFVTIPSTMTGGQSLRFIRDSISQAEVQAENQIGISVYDLLTLEATKIPLGSDGLIILPFLMGERTPIWDPYARGVIFGLSLNHTKGHIVRAMMEGVAYAMYSSYKLINDVGLKINFPLVMNEGGAVSRLWRKIITDVFNVPTVLVKRRTGAPYGDAILAGVASGFFPDFSIAGDWVEFVDHIDPSIDNNKMYMEYFEIYEKLYPKLKDDFQNLSKIRDRQ